MKVSLCTLLALSACAGAASAQSTVTIYGFADMGVSKSNSGSTPGTSLSGRGPANVWSVQQGNGSRLGFTGREDLGDGLFARFQLETRFFPDTGTSSAVFWNGRSVVVLGKTGWGEVYAGRDYSSAYFRIALAADPTAWSYVSQLGQPYTYANYNGSGPQDGSAVRYSNMVGYRSTNATGLNGELNTAAGEGVRKQATTGSLTYTAGPVFVGLGYDGKDADNRLLIGAATYDFGPAKLHSSYTDVKGGANGNAKSYTLGFQVPLSLGRAYAQLGHLDPTGRANNSRMFGVGGEYFMSKRTLLYANAGSAKKEGFTRTAAFDTGIKHSF